MERMIVAVFDTEAKAHQAVRALEALDDLGVIAVYEDGVITKDDNGTLTVVQAKRPLPQGTMGATAVGSLIGAFGGPVSLAVGAAGGFVLGAIADYARNRIERDFIADVKSALLPGRSAMVAEIDEESTARVDERMEALGGFVFRRALADVADDEYDGEIAAVRADIAQTRAEHAASRADRKERLQDRLDALDAKLHQVLDKAAARHDAIRQQAAAKVEHLKAQAAAAADDIKARRADRLASVTRRYNHWLDNRNAADAD